MTASHNASGAAALAWLDSLHATDANGAVTNRKWPEAQQVKALVKSAMALPGKWRAGAYSGGGHMGHVRSAAMRGCADELEAALGSAPPATDAPVMLTDDMNDIVLRGLAEGDPAAFATPPAGAPGYTEGCARAWEEVLLVLDAISPGWDTPDGTSSAIRACNLIRRLASGGGANNYGNASERDSQTDHRTAQCAQDTAEKMASRAGSGDSVRSGESPDIATQHALDIDAMVNRFLAWRLPDDFGPDAGISFTPNPQFPHAWPTGTNLLTAVQARAMFEHCAGGARVGQEAPTDSIRRVVAFIFRYFGSPAMAGELSEEMVADTRTVESWLAAPTPETPR